MGLAQAWRAYLAALDRTPICTKVLTGAVVTALGDVTAQLLLEKKSGLCWQRLAVVAGYGCLGSLFLGHYWLGFLEKLLGTSMSLSVSIKKMLLDVAVCGPTEVVCYISWTHTLERRPTPLSEKLRADGPTALASCLLWCPFSLVAFLCVPFHLRVLYGTGVCFLWDTLLSFVSHNRLGARQKTSRAE